MAQSTNVTKLIAHFSWSSWPHPLTVPTMHYAYNLCFLLMYTIGLGKGNRKHMSKLQNNADHDMQM